MDNFRLIDYDGDPASYKEIFDHNLKTIDRIQDVKIFSEFIAMLTDITRIDYHVILAELKRSLMICKEYYPERLRRRSLNVFLAPAFIALSIADLFKFKKYDSADILIDDWAEDVLPGLYGTELLSALAGKHKCLTANFYKVGSIQPHLLFKYYPCIVKCMAYNSRFIREHAIDLRPFIFTFFKNFLSGLSIKSTHSPKLLMSGNDNDCQVIKAKSAGMNVLFIQNGLRGHLSNSSFKYSDHYVSMGSDVINYMRQATGCIFKNIHSFGSLRLYNFMKSRKSDRFDIKYDLLWVSNWNLNSISELYKNYFRVEAERESIKTLIAYAEKHSNVAYVCRYAGEVQDLKKLGVFSERITYFERGVTSVYELVFQSRIILSTGSTVGHEAMGLGKKAGFVNLSKNRHLVSQYKDLGIEYNSDSTVSFEGFIESIKNRDIDYKKYVYQNPQYVPELLKIVSNILNAA